MDKNNLSSEDEFMIEALKEATDTHFLKEYFFKEMSSEDKTTNSCEQKSQRRDLKRRDDFKVFGVSDAFQNYISKHLTKIFDKSIKFVDNLEKHFFTAEKQGSNFGGGIRLLSRFDTVVRDVENATENGNFFINKKRRKPKFLKKDDNVPSKIKVKEAAVHPGWILSKCDTKAWANTKKEAEFKYKKRPDGSLFNQ
ncbi:uncharacterized protein LOC117168854 isoform X2 [Belonocnema kinseyi]|uniref:uncharacterized protein LOC117168854 isoform X2 n=1 Tax=Belonocnema kinseyi TaxID=2817044 RepID=UPI00143D5DB6|nr:uncharacterized protein LOC117168854 isoform X2 [Belonocnema kinseyi]